MTQTHSTSVIILGNDMDKPVIIDCGLYDFKKADDARNGTLLILYDVKNVIYNTKDVTEICRISSDKVMTITCAKETHTLCFLHD